MSDPTADALAAAFHALGTQISAFQTDEDLNWEKEKETAMQADEVAGRTAQVSRMEHVLLPSCRQQLVELLDLLDVAPKGTLPAPKLPQALELVESLGPSLRELYFVSNALAPRILSLGRESSTTDQAYGVLKKFRLDALRRAVCAIISGPLHTLFRECLQFVLTRRYAYHDADAASQRDRILSIAAQAYCDFNHILAIFPRSDLGVLKLHWAHYYKQMGDCQAKLTQQVDDSFDEPSAGAFGARVVALSQQALPVVKQARGFFKQLVYSTPFSFDDELSSAELEKLRRVAHPLASNLVALVDALLRFHHAQQVTIRNDLPHFVARAKTAMAHSLALMRTYVQPQSSDPTVPPEQAFSDLVSLINARFFPACDLLLAAAQTFAADFPVAR